MQTDRQTDRQRERQAERLRDEWDRIESTAVTTAAWDQFFYITSGHSGI